MKRHDRSAPIWLFSFVDLAFLLLIAFSQLVPDPAKTGVEVAELELPRIERIDASDAASAGAPLWQLRVLPLAGSDDPAVRRAPFELIEPAASEPAANAAPTTRAIDAAELAARLDVLRERALPRPLLAPHRDARSEDLLVAVSLLEGAWQQGRGITVQPVPAISAPADPRAARRGTR